MHGYSNWFFFWFAELLWLFFSIQEIILTVRWCENRVAKSRIVPKLVYTVLSFFNWCLQRMEVSHPQMIWEVVVNPFQGSPAQPRKTVEILRGKNSVTYFCHMSQL